MYTGPCASQKGILSSSYLQILVVKTLMAKYGGKRTVVSSFWTKFDMIVSASKIQTHDELRIMQACQQVIYENLEI